MSGILQNPRGGCVLAGAYASISTINRACAIYHSGPGCHMQNIAAQHGQAGDKTPNLWSVPSTNMMERDVVFGGIKKLRSTVEGAFEVIDADVFFILAGCTSGIIGEDVGSIAEEFRNKGKEVYAIDSPGFTGNASLGYEILWNNLIDQFIEKRPKDDKLVNIFGILPFQDPFWSGNLEEIARILSRLGLKVNTFYTNGQGIEEIRGCSAAALNIVINPWIFKGPAEKFEEKFGTPWLRYSGLPIGASDTTDFVLQVADKLGLDKTEVQKVIRSEKEYVYRYLSWSVSSVPWRRFAVVGDANSAVGITRYLANDFGFSPGLVVVAEEMFRDSDKERIIERVTKLDYARPPKVVFAADQYDINKTIEETDDLTMIIGSSNESEIGMQKGILTANVTYPVKGRFIYNRAIAGYKGSLTLMEDLYDNM